MIPADTTCDAARVQFSVLRRIGTTGRARMTVELCERVRTCVQAGIRDRHPDYSEEAVRMAMLRLTLGPKLFREVFPEANVEP